MSNVRTVSDTKRAFYDHFNRPIASVYRRVIEELMVEMHLLYVSEDFVYDALYALGIVTTFDRFMDGYRPEGDSEAIFVALCQSIEASPEQYRNDAQQMLPTAEEISTIDNFKEIVTNLNNAAAEGLPGLLKGISERDRFKYSRAFGIGLYTFLEKIDPEFVKDKDQLMACLKEVANSTGISFDKLQKDVELYCSNLDKMVQAKAIMADVMAADRKKREERAQAMLEKEAAQTTKTDDDNSSTSTSTGESGEGDEPKSQ